MARPSRRRRRRPDPIEEPVDRTPDHLRHVHPLGEALRTGSDVEVTTDAGVVTGPVVGFVSTAPIDPEVGARPVTPESVVWLGDEIAPELVRLMDIRSAVVLADG